MSETRRIEAALRALLDTPHFEDLADLVDAHASAHHQTSHGNGDAAAVHERDALLAVVAEALSARMPVVLPGQRNGRAA